MIDLDMTDIGAEVTAEQKREERREYFTREFAMRPGETQIDRMIRVRKLLRGKNKTVTAEAGIETEKQPIIQTGQSLETEGKEKNLPDLTAPAPGKAIEPKSNPVFFASPPKTTIGENKKDNKADLNSAKVTTPPAFAPTTQTVSGVSENIRLANEHFNRWQTTDDKEKAIFYLGQDNSFVGFYKLGDLYRLGRQNVVGHDLVQEHNKEKAAENYVLAAEKFHAAGVQVKLTGEGELATFTTRTLTEVNALLTAALNGNPLALFQLREFYMQELTCEEESKRMIDAEETQLEAWIFHCTKAAADLYHPVAAYELVTSSNYKKLLTTEEKMRYAMIAADPVDAHRVDTARGELAEYRGDKPPVSHTVILSSAARVDATCLAALYPGISLNHTKNITATHLGSKTYAGGCVLPSQHESYASRDKKRLASQEELVALQALSIDERRKREREKRLGLFDTSKSKKQDGAIVFASAAPSPSPTSSSNQK